METAEVIHASLHTGKWEASIDLTDAYCYMPIHPKFQKIPTVSCEGSGIQVQSPTLRNRTFSFGVHSGLERGQIHSFFTRGSNPSVKIGVDCQFEKNLT